MREEREEGGKKKLAKCFPASWVSVSGQRLKFLKGGRGADETGS